MYARRINREEVYKGKIFTVVQDEIEFENGKKAKWDLVMHNGACAIVPLTDQQEVILVRQYRNAEDGEILEIPAGKLEKDEEPLTCARRELEEEIGHYANSIKKLCAMYTAVGFSDEKLHLYLATDLVKTQQNLDEDEYIDIITYPLQEAIEMIFTGAIKDNKTIVGLLAAKEYLQNKF